MIIRGLPTKCYSLDIIGIRMIILFPLRLGRAKTIRPLYCAVTNYFQETLLFKGSLIHLQSQMSLEGNLGHFQQIMIITDMLR